MDTTLPVKIYEAIEAGDLTAVRRLFATSPDELSVQTFMGGQTWLGFACQVGNLEVVECLCDLGADPDLGDSHYRAKPICSAAGNDAYEVVKFLLARGVTLDVDASVRNPLFAAIVGRSPRIVDLLLKAGVDARVRYNSPTMKDMDAVAFALMRGEHECAEIIALWNADGDDSAAKKALAEADEIANRNAFRR